MVEENDDVPMGDSLSRPFQLYVDPMTQAVENTMGIRPVIRTPSGYGASSTKSLNGGRAQIERAS